MASNGSATRALRIPSNQRSPMATMRYHKFAARTAAALCSALALAGVAATSAGAASNSATTYSGSSLCVKGRAIQSAANVGFGSRQSLAYADPYGPGCVTPLALPVGNVATKADVYKWTGSAWAYCNGTGWIYDGYHPGFRNGDLFISASYGAE